MSATIFPRVLRDALTEGAARLGRALDKLDWPNGGKDAPCHEVNAVINISYYLGQAGFHLYAEGTTVNRGRIDLVGFDDRIAFALEAKNFGDINKQGDSILTDWKRLQKFYPLLTEVAGNQEAHKWWETASERWGIIVIASYRDPQIKDAWMSPDEAGFRQHMSVYKAHEQPQEVDGEAKGFLALYRATQTAVRGAEIITPGTRFKDCGEGWLMWAATPLDVQAA